jgi:hypothetical protein
MQEKLYLLRHHSQRTVSRFDARDPQVQWTVEMAGHSVPRALSLLVSIGTTPARGSEDCFVDLRGPRLLVQPLCEYWLVVVDPRVGELARGEIAVRAVGPVLCCSRFSSPR